MEPQDLKTLTESRSTGWGHFWQHYVEMVVAMLVGMMVLGMIARVLLLLLGHSDLIDHTELRALLMATNMTIGMSVWMRYRGHGWASVAEMGLAMYLPFLLLLVPYWAGALSGRAVMVGAHLLMLPLMLVPMLRRRDEYLRPHSRHPRTGTTTSGAATP